MKMQRVNSTSPKSVIPQVGGKRKANDNYATPALATDSFQKTVSFGSLLSRLVEMGREKGINKCCDKQQDAFRLGEEIETVSFGSLLNRLAEIARNEGISKHFVNKCKKQQDAPRLGEAIEMRRLRRYAQNLGIKVNGNESHSELVEAIEQRSKRFDINRLTKDLGDYEGSSSRSAGSSSSGSSSSSRSSSTDDYDYKSLMWSDGMFF